jgi:hypothetical protein
LERSVDLYFPQQLEEVDGVFREMQVFHGIFYHGLCYFMLFHPFSPVSPLSLAGFQAKQNGYRSLDSGLYKFYNQRQHWKVDATHSRSFSLCTYPPNWECLLL